MTGVDTDPSILAVLGLAAAPGLTAETFHDFLKDELLANMLLSGAGQSTGQG